MLDGGKLNQRVTIQATRQRFDANGVLGIRHPHRNHARQIRLRFAGPSSGLRLNGLKLQRGRVDGWADRCTPEQTPDGTERLGVAREGQLPRGRHPCPNMIVELHHNLTGRIFSGRQVAVIGLAKRLAGFQRLTGHLGGSQQSKSKGRQTEIRAHRSSSGGKTTNS